MSGWYNLLNQTIYYKEPTGYADGAITYSTTYSTIATYEEVSRTVTNSNGEEISVNTEIISESKIKENSKVWFNSDTSDDSNSRMVKNTRVYYDKLTGDEMYMSWL